MCNQKIFCDGWYVYTGASPPSPTPSRQHTEAQFIVPDCYFLGDKVAVSNGYQGSKQSFKPKNYCSLCGFKDHLATDGCPNFQDDMEKIIPVHPCQTSCQDCPSTVHPRLNHSATYCPFWISGPLHGNQWQDNHSRCPYARNYRPSFNENKPKTLVLYDWKRAFWACFRGN